jgi:hypothetical protein
MPRYRMTVEVVADEGVRRSNIALTMEAAAEQLEGVGSALVTCFEPMSQLIGVIPNLSSTEDTPVSKTE